MQESWASRQARRNLIIASELGHRHANKIRRDIGRCVTIKIAEGLAIDPETQEIVTPLLIEDAYTRLIIRETSPEIIMKIGHPTLDVDLELDESVEPPNLIIRLEPKSSDKVK